MRGYIFLLAEPNMELVFGTDNLLAMKDHFLGDRKLYDPDAILI